jgi:Fe-S cluster assembly ATP-binding protein
MVKMLLKIEILSVKMYGKEVLRNISLEIKKDEVHALLGLNASGKSTLTFSIIGFQSVK